MRDQMIDHGLDQPTIGTDTGYFQVVFPGPVDDIGRLRMPETKLRVTPAVEAQLNERQKEMVLLLVQGDTLTSRIPEVKVKVDSGGQATVYRFTDNGISYGLRELELRNQKDRERFYESAEILKTLQQKISLREEGSEFIYNLKEIGVVDSDNTNDAKGIIGAEIYQWVEGNSLADKLESLPAEITADIGYKISKALQFLHKYDIIHRDICPRNVILEANTSNPILIDFGISKFGKYDSDTVIQSEYTAPENKSKNFKWSYPADIFSLGKTLNAIMNPNDMARSKLEQIILNCTDENPAKRPTADMLVESLRALIGTLNIESRKAENLREISRIIESDKQKEWYLKAIAKFGPRFSSIALGLHETMFDKCAEAAQLIDFILEAYPNEKLKLTAVYNRDTDTFINILKGKRCIDFMQNLRIERTHFDKKKSQPEILRKFSYPTETQMKSWAIEGGELTAKALELSSLPVLITRILG